MHPRTLSGAAHVPRRHAASRPPCCLRAVAGFAAGPRGAHPAQRDKSPAPVRPAKTPEVSDDVTVTSRSSPSTRPRMVTLMGETGDVRRALRRRGPNFAQIPVGALQGYFKRTLGATLLPVGSDPALATGGVVAGRAPWARCPRPASAPSSASAEDHLDRRAPRHRGVRAALRPAVAHTLMTSEGREFVKGLKIGDPVQLDYPGAGAHGRESGDRAGARAFPTRRATSSGNTPARPAPRRRHRRRRARAASAAAASASGSSSAREQRAEDAPESSPMPPVAMPGCRPARPTRGGRR